ncbi:MarR family transcriptional regulator [candidate division KSB1 bacterium]|nr:MarR family transcriptional regulator [candidate division KSB1 bacterium]
MSDKATTSVELADIISVLFANCQIKENLHVTQFGVSIVEFRCLRILKGNPNITVNNLAHKMSLTSSRITRIVDGLVKKKLVDRISGENDRRIYHLSLTSQGKNLILEMLEKYNEMHDEILRPIPPEQKTIMLDCLKQLNRAVTSWLQAENQN